MTEVEYQGTVLGPLHFILFVGYIDTEIQQATAVYLADDTVITMKVQKTEDHERLQEDLNVIYNGQKRTIRYSMQISLNI